MLLFMSDLAVVFFFDVFFKVVIFLENVFFVYYFRLNMILRGLYKVGLRILPNLRPNR